MTKRKPELKKKIKKAVIKGSLTFVTGGLIWNKHLFPKRTRKEFIDYLSN